MDKLTVKQELKLLGCLNKLFVAESETLELSDMTDEFGYMTPDSVCMIVCKTPQVKELFKRFTNKHQKQAKIPQLDYTHNSLISRAVYSVEYLNALINCFKGIDINPRIYLKKDYPLTLECDHFSFILAPRVTED